MKKFTNLAFVLGMLTCLLNSNAHATAMIASWSGRLYSDGTTAATGFVANNSLVNFKFMYDTNNLGTFQNIIDGKLVKYDGGINTPSIYSQITMSINGGSEFDITSYFAPTTGAFSDLLLGTNSDRYRNISGTANGETYLSTDFSRSGALLSLDPTASISLTNISDTATFIMVTETTNIFSPLHSIHGYLESLSVYAAGQSTTVPAPGALMLLGFGLLGVGGLRRNAKAL